MYRIIVVAALILVSVQAHAQEANQLPFMAGETWQCTRGYNTGDTHLGSNALALDFAQAGCSSYGKPILATRSGRVTFAGSNGPYGNEVTIDVGEGNKIKVAHLSGIVVKRGENVAVGQVLGFCGNTGNVEGASCPDHPGMHVHVVEQQGTQGVSLEPISGYTGLTAGPSYTSSNSGAFDREFTSMGGSGTFGSALTSIEWSNGYVYNDHQYSDGRAKAAYWRKFASTSGGWYRSAIVYDALGGARKAYTVRTGFWEETVDSPGGEGWSELGGSQSQLGMPITNEYSWNGGARQDFQRGYLRWTQADNVTVQTTGYVPPGWVESGYWDKTFSYLMAMAYDRNGRDAAVGHATGSATFSNFSAPGASSSYYKQAFTGGSNGDGAIFYHPDNAVKNPQATNGAYYLYGAFWTYWTDNGGANAFGVPTRDWYMSQDPATWSGPTYPLQNFMRANGEQHYMLLRNGAVEWHSSYNSDWVTQAPFVIDLVRGQTTTFSVTYKNTGSTTWLGAGSDPSNPDHIELRACSAWPDGDVQDSWLWPGSGSGWISPSRVVTATQASVAPGQNATFTFTVKVPTNQALGSDQRAYFRPYHTIGGLIEEWDGYYVQVNVINPPSQAFGLILRNPTTAEWWVRPSNGSAFYYPSGVNTPPDRWLNAWAQDGGGYTFTPYAGDPNGDGYDDLIVQRSDANWYVAWNNQNGSFTPQGQAILSPWGTGGYPGKYFFWFTNMNTDQKSELLTYDAANANWYVCTFNINSNTYDNCSQWTSWGGGVGVFQPLVGDWNGDGKTDICLRNWSTGAHWVRLSSGTGFTQPNPDNWIVWGATGDPATFTPLAGDWNGDGKADILLYNPSSAEWYVRTSSGSAFVYPSGSNNPADRWQAGWSGSGYIPFVGDFNYDGKTDIGLRNPTMGDHWVRTSTGLAFTQPSPDNWQGAWGASSSFQLVTGRFGSGNPGGGYSMHEAPPDEGRSPTLSFALWTAPNPTSAATTLHFALPTADRVRLTILDIHGRSVMSVPDREYGPGLHALTWNRTDPNGGRVSSGIYFLKLTSQKHAATAKVVVVN